MTKKNILRRPSNRNRSSSPVSNRPPPPPAKRVQLDQQVQEQQKQTPVQSTSSQENKETTEEIMDIDPTSDENKQTTPETIIPPVIKLSTKTKLMTPLKICFLKIAIRILSVLKENKNHLFSSYTAQQTTFSPEKQIEKRQMQHVTYSVELNTSLLLVHLLEIPPTTQQRKYLE